MQLSCVPIFLLMCVGCVYTSTPLVKKRVNISIETALHTAAVKRGKLLGLDFTNYLEYLIRNDLGLQQPGAALTLPLSAEIAAEIAADPSRASMTPRATKARK
jgi:hypothetical protein